MKAMAFKPNLKPWEHAISHNQFKNSSEVIQIPTYWFNLSHFAMDDPV